MSANTPQSRKSKGRTFQNHVREMLLDTFPTLTERDIVSRSMGSKGTDIMLSEEASKKIPFDVECKRSEHINIWSSFFQSFTRANETGNLPLLVFRRNRSQVMCAMEFEVLLDLLAKCCNYIEGEGQCPRDILLRRDKKPIVDKHRAFKITTEERTDNV